MSYSYDKNTQIEEINQCNCVVHHRTTRQQHKKMINKNLFAFMMFSIYMILSRLSIRMKKFTQ